MNEYVNIQSVAQNKQHAAFTILHRNLLCIVDNYVNYIHLSQWVPFIYTKVPKYHKLGFTSLSKVTISYLFIFV